MGFPLPVICSGRPIELDKPHILALAAETGFLLFKEQVPIKFKKEISAVQCERKSFRLISLSTTVSFRWTVPLRLNKGPLFILFLDNFTAALACLTETVSLMTSHHFSQSRLH